MITEPAVLPASPTSTAAAPPLLEVRSLTKTFGDLHAHQNIDLAIYGGEVHAILGENGAGKSTLMKCLYGFYQPTSGGILLEGKPVRIDTPLAGRRLGIGMVFQNFTLIPAMTVAENVALFLPELGIVLRPKAIRARIAEVAAPYGLEIDPGAHVADLAMGNGRRWRSSRSCWPARACRSLTSRPACWRHTKSTACLLSSKSCGRTAMPSA